MTGVLSPPTALPQERRLVTEIPGPRSRELIARRDGRGVRRRRHDAAGVRRAGRRRRARRRRRQLADRPRLRHRGRQRRQRRAARSSRAVQRAGRARSPTPASWSRRTRATSRSARQLDRLTPGDHEKRSALFNSGAEAVENAVKIARPHTGRQAVVVFDHAYHGRTNLTMALTAKNMPYKHGFGPFAPRGLPGADVLPVPRRPGLTGAQAAARALDLIEKQVGADNVAARGDRADPGRGRLRRPGRRASCRRSPSGAATTAPCSSPTRSRPASAAPATGSPASTRASSPTWSPPPRASPAGCRSPRSPAAPRSWTPCTPAASAAPTAATRSPAPPRSARSRRCASWTSPAARAGIEATMLPRLRALAASASGVIGDVRGRGAMLAVELVRPGTHRARRRRSTGRGRAGAATPRASSSSPAAPTATCCASCRRW